MDYVIFDVIYAMISQDLVDTATVLKRLTRGHSCSRWTY